MKKSISCFLCLIIISLLYAPAACAVSAQALSDVAYGILRYKKTSLGLEPGESLFSGSFSDAAGSTAGDSFTRY